MNQQVHEKAYANKGVPLLLYKLGTDYLIRMVLFDYILYPRYQTSS